VDEGIDTGPILAQRAVELPSARLPAEVRATLRPLEHALLCDVVRRFARGDVRPDADHPRRWLVGPTG
jgi:folate-dependent phosphoribosylglycinamide formyltransferase PurN